MTEAGNVENLGARLEELTLLVTQQADRLRQQEARSGTPQAVYVPRDRKVPVFTGFPEKPGIDRIDIEEWTEAMKSAFRTWHVPVKDQTDVVLDYLGGQAKKTVKLMSDLDRADIDKIFEALQSIYGDTVTVGGLLKDFHSRSQRHNEKIRVYAYDLQEKIQRILRRDRRRLTNPDPERTLCNWLM